MSEKCHSLLLNRRGQPLAQVGTVSIDLEDGHVIAEHFHPEDQLIFASKGVMTVQTKQGIWVVPPLRAVWIPAGTPHSVTMSGLVSMRTLYFLPKIVRALPKKCFVMNVSSLLRELILHACKFPKLNRKIPVQKRIIELTVDQLAAANSIPLQLPHPLDSRAVRIVEALLADPEQKNGPAAVPRANENDIWEVAAAVETVTRDAPACRWRKSDGRGIGFRL
jgi:hypothetical protein